MTLTIPEHDGLDPFPALATGQALPECPRVPGNQGLPKLVAVVASAVAGIYEDLSRARELLRVLEGWVLTQ